MEMKNRRNYFLFVFLWQFLLLISISKAARTVTASSADSDLDALTPKSQPKLCYSTIKQEIQFKFHKNAANVNVTRSFPLIFRVNTTVTTSEKKPIRVQKYDWCFSLQLKCSKYVTEMRTIIRNEVRAKENSNFQ